MSQEEWYKIYGRNYQDKWETKVTGIDLYQENNTIKT